MPRVTKRRRRDEYRGGYRDTHRDTRRYDSRRTTAAAAPAPARVIPSTQPAAASSDATDALPADDMQHRFRTTTAATSTSDAGGHKSNQQPHWQPQCVHDSDEDTTEGRRRATSLPQEPSSTTAFSFTSTAAVMTTARLPPQVSCGDDGEDVVMGGSDDDADSHFNLAPWCFRCGSRTCPCAQVLCPAAPLNTTSFIISQTDTDQVSNLNGQDNGAGDATTTDHYDEDCHEYSPLTTCESPDLLDML